jgi:hypothetical protein
MRSSFQLSLRARRAGALVEEEPPNISATARPAITGKNLPATAPRAASASILRRSPPRTAPCRSGSKIRVTNKGNGRSVVVRINDRGPFTKHRLIDISYAAAQQIQMVRAGKARVRLELLTDQAAAAPLLQRGCTSHPL